MSPVEVRPERPGDESVIARLNDVAFGQPDEARIIDEVRRAGAAAVSLVAVADAEIVGHILFTPVVLESRAFAGQAMGLGPMAVWPGWQRRGIGSMLVQVGLYACARVGGRAVVVVGHPEFYPRFGFRRASAFGLRCEYPVPDEAFMAVELVPGALAGCGGLVRYLREFGEA